MSLKELLKLYAGLSTPSGLSPSTGASAAPPPSNQPAQGDGSLQLGRPPDASYFSSQAEAVLASIQQLRLLYQQQQEEEEGTQPHQASGASGGPQVGAGIGTSSTFSARADELAATVGALAAAFAAAAAAASEPAGTPSRSAAFPSASGTSRAGAGAGGGVGGAWPYSLPVQQQQMPTEPLVSLFTSFMAQVAGSREVSLAGGMADGPGGGGGEGGDTKKRKNRKKKKKAQRGGNDDVQRGGNDVLWAEATPGAAPPHHLQPGSGLAGRPGPAAGGVEEGGDASSASASLAVLPGSSKRRGRKAKGQARDHQSDGAGRQVGLEAMQQLGDEATVAARPPVEGVDSQASDTADGAVNGTANGSAGDGAGEGGDSGASSSSSDDGNSSSSGDDGGDGSDGEGDDEAAAAPSASELALMFGRFLRGPGGLAGLPPVELQAIMMATQQGGDGAGPGAAGGLPAEAVRMQAEVEARHAELLATTPEAAALWEDAKLMAGVAAHGGLQYRSRPGSAPVGGKDGLGGGVLLGGGEAGGIDSPLRPPGAMLGGGAEGTEWQSPLIGRSMHSAVELDDEHSGEGVSVRGRKGPVCGRMDWGRSGRTLNICTLVRLCVSLQCWKINAVALPSQCL